MRNEMGNEGQGRYAMGRATGIDEVWLESLTIWHGIPGKDG